MKRKILTLALVVIGIAAGVVLIVGAATKPSSTKTIKSESFVSDSDIIPSLKTQLINKYPFLSSMSIDTSNNLGYPVPNQAFNLILSATSNSSLSFADKTSTNEIDVYNALSTTNGFLKSYFKNNDYQLIGDTKDSSFLSDSIYFQNTSQICQVTVYSLLDITCENKNQLNSSAAAAKPLVAVYTSDSSDTSTVTVSAPSFQASQTAGYKTALMDVWNSGGQVKAYFYSLNNSGWIMVNPSWFNDPHEDGDVMPNCENFDSNASVAEAFKGLSCYDSANRETSIVAD